MTKHELETETFYVHEEGEWYVKDENEKVKAGPFTFFDDAIHYNVSSYSLEELQAMHDRGETLPDSPDAPEADMPEDFWNDAEIVSPTPSDTLAALMAEDAEHL